MTECAATSLAAACEVHTPGIECVSRAFAGAGDNDVSDESNSGYESKRGDEANEYNDESESGDEANNDDNLLDRVYEAVRDGQTPCELHRDGWHTGTIHEAVGIWYDLGAFVKSQEKSLCLATGLEEVDWQRRTFLTRTHLAWMSAGLFECADVGTA